MPRSRADPIRRAGAGDARVIAELLYAFNREYDEPTPPRDELAERIGLLLGGGDTIVLVAGAPPCGLAVLRFRPAIWSRALECYLAELYVAPPDRGQGIGRALMERAIDVARSEGADRMDLGTGEADVAARALYESLGFDNHEHGPSGVSSVSYFYERDL